MYCMVRVDEESVYAHAEWCGRTYEDILAETGGNSRELLVLFHKKNRGFVSFF